jgi:hypothetical protein
MTDVGGFTLVWCQTTTNNPTRRVRTINQWRTRDIRQVLNFSPGSSGYLAMVT